MRESLANKDPEGDIIPHIVESSLLPNIMLYLLWSSTSLAQTPSASLLQCRQIVAHLGEGSVFNICLFREKLSESLGKYSGLLVVFNKIVRV